MVNGNTHPAPEDNAAPGPAEAAQPAAQPANNDGQRVSPVAIRVEVPDLRNGEITGITQAAPRASIPRRFNWAVIRNFPTGTAVQHVEALIRATYAQFLTGAPGQVTDAMRTEARNAAIVMGSIRAVCIQAWSLDRPDMNIEETAGTGSEFVAGANGQLGLVRQHAGTAGGNFTVAQGMAGLTDAEVDVVNLLLYLGAAVPVMQGISLVLSGHHFLPTTKNHFMGMKRQALQMGSDAIRQWVDSLGESFDDWAFHKSVHPISPPVKRRWAKSRDVAARLTASGHTSVAIRVPALPSDAQGCKAAIAVIIKASPVIRGMGHTVSWEDGLARIASVEEADEGAAELSAVASARAWLTAHASEIGFCIGIVQYLVETGGATGETTLRAFSTRRIAADQAAEVTRGTTYCRAYLARIREQAQEGVFPDPRIIA